jgi:hypothetical protein
MYLQNHQNAHTIHYDDNNVSAVTGVSSGITRSYNTLRPYQLQYVGLSAVHCLIYTDRYAHSN